MYTSKNVIYKATNLLNGKVYIGYTSQAFRDRQYVHKQRSNSTDAKWKTKFYNAIRKYGWENFKWEILEEFDNVDSLQEREIYWINRYDSYNNGYNGTLGGDGTFGMTGEKCVNSKITEQQAIEIKRMLVDGRTHQYISDSIDGVTIHMATDIAQQKTWNHVTVDGWDLFLKNKKVGNQRLRKNDVSEIQKMLIDHISYKVIASEFNVSEYTIADIANGRTWKSVSIDGWDEYLKRDKMIGENHGGSKLTDSSVGELKSMLMNGISRKDVASTFNVTIGAITSIVGGRSWSHVTVDGWDEWVLKNRRKSPRKVL